MPGRRGLNAWERGPQETIPISKIIPNDCGYPKIVFNEARETLWLKLKDFMVIYGGTTEGHHDLDELFVGSEARRILDEVEAERRREIDIPNKL